MAEIVTESFCERCGTRYTFESAPSKSRPLAALGTFGRGLKHFVASPENSFDESLAIARSEQEQRSTNLQLEAFHQTFNFCLSCRQYTCADCWNPVEGRCLSCAPVPEAVAEVVTDVATEVAIEAPAPMSTDQPWAADGWAVDAVLADADTPPPAFASSAGAPVDVGDRVEPDVDLGALDVGAIDAEVIDLDGSDDARAIDEPIPLPEPEPEPEPVPDPLPEPEPVAAQAQPEPIHAHAQPEPVAADGEPEFLAADAEPILDAEPAVGSFVPGRSLDDEIAAYELRIAALAEPAPEPEPEPAPEPERAPEPALEAAPQPEPPRPVETRVAMPEPPQRPAPRPSFERPIEPQPTQVPHPAFIPSPRPASQPPAQAQLGGTPLGATPAPAPGHLATPEVPPETGGAPTLATCQSCGLSLSASARFCRRCGTRQHE